MRDNYSFKEKSLFMVKRLHELNISIQSSLRVQPAGMWDKNGKIIFAGDIVQLHLLNRNTGEYKRFDERYIIIWDKLAFCLRDIQTRKNFYLNIFKNGELEIIGNVNENPELLEVAHATI